MATSIHLWVGRGTSPCRKCRILIPGAQARSRPFPQQPLEWPVAPPLAEDGETESQQCPGETWNGWNRQLLCKGNSLLRTRPPPRQTEEKVRPRRVTLTGVPWATGCHQAPPHIPPHLIAGTTGQCGPLPSQAASGYSLIHALQLVPATSPGHLPTVGTSRSSPQVRSVLLGLVLPADLAPSASTPAPATPHLAASARAPAPDPQPDPHPQPVLPTAASSALSPLGLPGG